MTNKDRLKQLFFELVEIDSESGKERKMADHLKGKLFELGGEPYEDQAGEKMGTEAGNLICRIEGDNSKAPIILSAHMDTVKPGIGKKAIIDGDIIKSEGDTVLGSDDAGGIAAILEAVKAAQENYENHAPVEIVFTAYEEGGLNGSRRMDFDRLTSTKSYIFDSNGPVGTMIVEAPGQDKYNIKVEGKSAHAGLKPEEGINAIKVASDIVSQLELGRLDDKTTANIGVMKGGEATNVVCPLVELQGEARSRDEQRLKQVTDQIKEICEQVTEKYGAGLNFDSRRLYSAYNLDQEDEVVKHCLTSMEKLNLTPKFEATGGGSDANIFNANGIKTVNLGMGYEKVHTTDEYIPVKELERAADLAYYLITM